MTATMTIDVPEGADYVIFVVKRDLFAVDTAKEIEVIGCVQAGQSRSFPVDNLHLTSAYPALNPSAMQKLSEDEP